MFGRDMSTRKLSLATVGLVLGFYFWEWCSYMFLAKPPIGWTIVFNVVLFMAVWSYLQTVWTDPGTSRCPEWRAWSEARAASGAEPTPKTTKEDKHDRRRSWEAGRATWCPECDAERPERAHHCKESGVCVMRMDHYCPWIGNCVGFRNYKYFLLMNFWTFWVCTIWLATMNEPSPIQAVNLFLDGKGDAGPAVGTIIAVVFWAVTGGMFCHSTSMVCRNLTTIEEFLPGSNPYQLESASENAKQVVGSMDWRILFPIPPLDAGTGTDYPLRTDATLSAAAPGEGYGSCEEP